MEVLCRACRNVGVGVCDLGMWRCWCLLNRDVSVCDVAALPLSYELMSTRLLISDR